MYFYCYHFIAIANKRLDIIYSTYIHFYYPFPGVNINSVVWVYFLLQFMAHDMACESQPLCFYYDDKLEKKIVNKMEWWRRERKREKDKTKDDHNHFLLPLTQNFTSIIYYLYSSLLTSYNNLCFLSVHVCAYMRVPLHSGKLAFTNLNNITCRKSDIIFLYSLPASIILLLCDLCLIHTVTTYCHFCHPPCLSLLQIEYCHKRSVYWCVDWNVGGGYKKN